MNNDPAESEYQDALLAFHNYPRTGETQENASLLCNLDSIIAAAGRTDDDFEVDLLRLDAEIVNHEPTDCILKSKANRP